MAYTYIIHSKQLNKFYVGACQSELESRISKHNSGFYGKKSSTTHASDWLLFLSFEYDTYAHAINLERKIKSMKSSKYIRNLKKYEELRNKIYELAKT